MTIAPVTLCRADLVGVLCETVGLNRRESTEMVDAFFDQICTTLLQAEDVKLAGFGNFAVRRKAPRPGRNPRTDEIVPIPARSVVRFQATKALRTAIALGSSESVAVTRSTVASSDT